VLNEETRSSSLNNDFAFFDIPAAGKSPHRRAALAIRYASARAARDFVKSDAENSSQFAVWSLKRVNIII